MAVISCHGKVVPGTLGVRAEHAAIEALWLSDNVSGATRHLVSSRYPRAAAYHSLAAMLAEHPLTSLSSYRLPPRPRPRLVHAGLAVTVAWWLLMLVWALAAAPAPALASSAGWVDAAALLAPMAIAFKAALVLLTRPRRWPVGLLALALQTTLVAAGQPWLQPYSATRQVASMAGAAGTLHVAVASRAWWLRLRLDARGSGPGSPRRWGILPL